MLDALKDALLPVLQTACRKATKEGRPSLAFAGVPAPHLDLLALFAHYHTAMDTSLWFGLGQTAFLGLGCACQCSGQGQDRFAAASAVWQAAMASAVKSGDAVPVALGGFRFDTASAASDVWRGFADGSLVIPSLCIRQEQDGKTSCLAAIEVQPGMEAAACLQSFMDRWQGLESVSAPAAGPEAERVTFHVPEGEKERWRQFVLAALETIAGGAAKKIVAARMARVTAAGAFPLAQVVARLHADNPQAATFAFCRDGNCFIGATPEILSTAREGLCRTMALAGSAPRGENPAEDDRIGQELLDSEKNRTEHDFVVQAVRRALGKCCGDVQADPAPSLHKLRRIQHLVTHFRGRILPGSSLLDMVASLHPTPAVGGVPTDPSLAFLREHESMDRGWFAGPVGWLDANDNGEFMVALRSGVVRGDEAALFAGCGLVAGSDPEKEYQETRLKFSTVLDGLCPEWRAGTGAF